MLQTKGLYIMTEDHHRFIRRCIELAESAMNKGNHPFGAVLVHKGEIILEAENTVHSASDPTGHAELNLVRMAAQQFSPEILAEASLYSSTEPCMMCSGAIYWAGLSHVVYACAETTLAKYAGDDFLSPCRDNFAKGKRRVNVEGPLLEEEAAVLHAKFW
jgi:tRNA(Arg) A34 adenosine deaminase TadA